MTNPINFEWLNLVFWLFVAIATICAAILLWPRRKSSVTPKTSATPAQPTRPDATDTSPAAVEFRAAEARLEKPTWPLQGSSVSNIPATTSATSRPPFNWKKFFATKIAGTDEVGYEEGTDPADRSTRAHRGRMLFFIALFMSTALGLEMGIIVADSVLVGAIIAIACWALVVMVDKGFFQQKDRSDARNKKVPWYWWVIRLGFNFVYAGFASLLLCMFVYRSAISEYLEQVQRAKSETVKSAAEKEINAVEAEIAEENTDLTNHPFASQEQDLLDQLEAQHKRDDELTVYISAEARGQKIDGITSGGAGHLGKTKEFEAEQGKVRGKIKDLDKELAALRISDKHTQYLVADSLSKLVIQNYRSEIVKLQEGRDKRVAELLVISNHDGFDERAKAMVHIMLNGSAAGLLGIVLLLIFMYIELSPFLMKMSDDPDSYVRYLQKKIAENNAEVDIKITAATKKSDTAFAERAESWRDMMVRVSNAITTGANAASYANKAVEGSIFSDAEKANLRTMLGSAGSNTSDNGTTGLPSGQ